MSCRSVSGNAKYITNECRDVKDQRELLGYIVIIRMGYRSAYDAMCSKPSPSFARS